MESGINYKGLLYAFNENDVSIYAFQGEVSKVSNGTDFTGTDYVTKFLEWRAGLYALVSDGRLLKLDHMVTGDEDVWEEVCDAGEDSCDIVNFQDSIFIIGTLTIYKWDGTSLTTISSLPSGYSFYCALSVEDSIYLYGDDGTNVAVTKYNGNLTFTDIWQDTTHATLIDFSFYNKNGKPHLVEYKGQLYFTYYYDNLTTHLVKFDLSSLYYEDVQGITDSSITGIVTAMLIDDGMILLPAFENVVGSDSSNVYVHILEDYTQEETFVSGYSSNYGKLYRVDSDPILSSQHDKERLIYYSVNTVVGCIGGDVQPVFKYGGRLEPYTDLNDVSSLQGVNLKALTDDLCNLLDSYLIVKPENIAFADMKSMVGRSDKLLTLSDDEGYGDLQILKVNSYKQGENNFRRVSIHWSNPIIGDGVEVVGVPGTIAVNEYSFDSFLVNNPSIANNIATYIFNNMFSSDVLSLDCEYAPFLRVGNNVNIKTVGSYLYISEDKEFKIVDVNHNFKRKYTKLVLAERNLIFNTLEI